MTESIQEPKSDLARFVNTPDFSNEQLKVIQQSVAKNTTASELAYFANVCKSVGLNPFNKEIWCYKDNRGNLLIFTSRDGYLRKAQENPAYNGIRSCEVREGDTFSIDVANNEIKHTIASFTRGNVLGAYAIVFRKGGEPTIELADMKTYNKALSNGKANVWNTNPAEMIKKVAEAHALKKAFGLGGLQLEEDWTVQDGEIVEPIATEVIEKSKMKITDEEFKEIQGQSLEWIKKHIGDYELTQDQEAAIQDYLDQQRDIELEKKQGVQSE